VIAVVPFFNAQPVAWEALLWGLERIHTRQAIKRVDIY
jgi:hypothetical protein